MTTPSDNGIINAIRELEEELANLDARRPKLVEAIAMLRALFHLPDARKHVEARLNGRKAKAPRAAKTDGAASKPGPKSAVTLERVQHALRGGPLSPGAVARQLGIPVGTMVYHLRRMVKDGHLVASGTTLTRRYALPGKPGKEAP